MPPLQLTNLLHTTLPHLSVDGRALLSALGCVNGRPTSISDLAQWLGFHDRYQLARALRREGLPPMETLGGWTRTLYWIIESQTSGVTLRELARREHLDPAVAYRLVRRITGRRWSDISHAGLPEALLSFRDHCRGRASAAQIRQATAQPGPMRRLPLARHVLPSAPEINRPCQSPRLLGILGKRVPVSGAPFDVALTATRRALVTRGHAAAVDVLVLDAPRVERTIAVGPVPTRAVPSADGEWGYVTSQFSEAVAIVDLRAGRQVAAIRVGGHPLGAVLSRDGQTLYVSTNRDRLVALSLSRQCVVADIPIPHASPQLCLHPSGRRVYASGWRRGVVAEIDVPALRLLRTFELGGTVQDVAVTADGQTLYAANEAGRLDVVHLPTGKRSSMLKVASAALGLALSADGADVIVGLLHAGQVLIVDRRTLQVRATLHTGGVPRLMAADPNGLVLVANEAGWVDFIH